MEVQEKDLLKHAKKSDDYPSNKKSHLATALLTTEYEEANR